MDVTVIDKESGPGQGCSFANGGGLLPSTGAPWNEPDVIKTLLKYFGRSNAPLQFKLSALPSMVPFGLKFLSFAKEKKFLESTILNTRLGFYSSETMQVIEHETGLEFGANDCGMTCIFRDQKSQDSTQNFFDLLSEEGVTYRLLTTDQVMEKEPSLIPIKAQITGGVFCAGERSADPYLFCTEMHRYLVAKGVRFSFDTRVIDIQKPETGFVLHAADSIEIQCDKLVIAAGSYSAVLARKLGVKVPVKPAKGYSLSIPMSGWDNPPQTVIADMGLHVGVNPLHGQILRVAGTAEFAGYSGTISRRRIQYLVNIVEQIFPEFASIMDRSQLNPWTGLRPMSVDGVAILGSTPITDLYLCTGQGHIGWTTAAGSGKIVSDIMTGRPPGIDVAGYSIERFGV